MSADNVGTLEVAYDAAFSFYVLEFLSKKYLKMATTKVQKETDGCYEIPELLMGNGDFVIFTKTGDSSGLFYETIRLAYEHPISKNCYMNLQVLILPAPFFYVIQSKVRGDP